MYKLCDAQWLFFVFNNEKTAAKVIFSTRIKCSILKDRFHTRVLRTVTMMIIRIIMEIKTNDTAVYTYVGRW